MAEKCKSCTALRKWLEDERKMTQDLTDKLKASRDTVKSLRTQLKGMGNLDADIVAREVAKAIGSGLGHYVVTTTHATVTALRDGALAEEAAKKEAGIKVASARAVQRRIDNRGPYG
jgi:hypothetical protein